MVLVRNVAENAIPVHFLSIDNQVENLMRPNDHSEIV